MCTEKMHNKEDLHFCEEFPEIGVSSSEIRFFNV